MGDGSINGSPASLAASGAAGEAGPASPSIAAAPNLGGITPGRTGILGQLFGGGTSPTGGGVSSGALKDILGAGVLGLDLVNANKKPAGLGALQALAGQQQGLAKSWGAQAEGEAQGILPAGAQALVQNTLDANIAAIKQKYSQLKMSGSSAETQDINAAKAQALAETFQIGQQMSQTGLAEASSASGQESQLLQAILASETAQGTALGDALAGFAGAAAK